VPWRAGVRATQACSLPSWQAGRGMVLAMIRQSRVRVRCRPERFGVGRCGSLAAADVPLPPCRALSACAAGGACADRSCARRGLQCAAASPTVAGGEAVRRRPLNRAVGCVDDARERRLWLVPVEKRALRRVSSCLNSAGRGTASPEAAEYLSVPGDGS
jgi:hypothetical protein